MWDGIRRTRIAKARREQQQHTTYQRAEVSLQQHHDQHRALSAAPVNLDAIEHEEQLSLFTQDEQPAAVNDEFDIEVEYEETDIDADTGAMNNIDMMDTVTSELSDEQHPEFDPENVIALYVMAREGYYFTGQQVLQALLKSGCRYGKHHIFHRHVRLDGKGPVYFSIASAKQPGTFDIRNMHGEKTTGLCLFMSATNPQNTDMIFQLMREAARTLAEELHAHVCDEERKPLSYARIKKYNTRIKQLTEVAVA
tara:strand:+ start:93292 stop:94050 length:759 start_codon:yes stop_codon:yes gene_type:complete